MNIVKSKFREIDYNNSFDENIIGIIIKMFTIVDVYRAKYKIEANFRQIYLIKQLIRENLQYKYIHGASTQLLFKTRRMKNYKSYNMYPLDQMNLMDILLSVKFSFEHFVMNNEITDPDTFAAYLSIYIARKNDKNEYTFTYKGVEYNMTKEEYEIYKIKKEDFKDNYHTKYLFYNKIIKKTFEEYYDNFNLLLFEFPIEERFKITYAEFKLLIERYKKDLC